MGGGVGCSFRDLIYYQSGRKHGSTDDTGAVSKDTSISGREREERQRERDEEEPDPGMGF